MQNDARTSIRVVDVVLRAGIVGLTLTTAAIHSTLGGTLFSLNAIGYVTLAAAMVAPGRAFGSVRWLSRLALMGYTAATVVGWYAFGPRYDTAYIAKGIELVLMALLVVESYHNDGSPVQIARRIAGLVGRVLPGRSNGTPRAA